MMQVFKGKWRKPDTVAVHGVSLVIERNECFGMLGPNGAGKTTTMSMITGQLAATAGSAPRLFFSEFLVLQSSVLK